MGNSILDVTGGWTQSKLIPGWFGAENQGRGIAVADINGDGKPEFIVFHIDNPTGDNHGYYRIGRGLDGAGNVAAWTNPQQVPGWFGWDGWTICVVLTANSLERALVKCPKNKRAKARRSPNQSRKYR